MRVKRPNKAVLSCGARKAALHWKSSYFEIPWLLCLTPNIRCKPEPARKRARQDRGDASAEEQALPASDKHSDSGASICMSIRFWDR